MSRTTTIEERREFLVRAASVFGVCTLGALVSSGLVGCGGNSNPASSSTSGPVQVDVSKQAGLAAVGGAIKMTFSGADSGYPILIIRISQQEFLTLSTICTHQGCEVNLPGVRAPAGIISCDCHGSEFSALTGAVVRGPASAPLHKFSNSFDASTNMLSITV